MLDKNEQIPMKYMQTSMLHFPLQTSICVCSFIYTHAHTPVSKMGCVKSSQPR